MYYVSLQEQYGRKYDVVNIILATYVLLYVYMSYIQNEQVKFEVNICDGICVCECMCDKCNLVIEVRFGNLMYNKLTSNQNRGQN